MKLPKTEYPKDASRYHKVPSSAYTTKTELEQACKELDLPLRYCWYDDSFAGFTEPGLYIFNLGFERELRGTHWTSAWFNGKTVLYFDSLGLPPSNDIETKVRGSYFYSPNVIQDPSGGYCGQYALAFGVWISRYGATKTSFEYFLSQFNQNFKRNSKILFEMLEDGSQS